MSTISVVSIALMGILLFLLGANVTRHRARVGMAGGNQQPSDPADPLLVAIRAHGNAAEYVPTLVVLLLVCSSLTDGWWIDTLAIVALVARTSHGVGMLASGSLAKRTVWKEGGAIATYLAGVALGVTAIVSL
jgi:uncharacterized membrane protein YecN with MAPEG domain